MDSKVQPNDEKDSNDVSCFTVDGVVAEMVIDIEDSPQKGLKLVEEKPQQSKPVSGSSSNSDKKVETAPKKEKHSTSKQNTHKSVDNESKKTKSVDEDDSESLSSLPDLEKSAKDTEFKEKISEKSSKYKKSKEKESSKHKELKESIISDLEQITGSPELSDESKDKIEVDEKKGGNKRKLAEIEDDNEINEKKRANMGEDSKSKRKLHNPSSSDSKGPLKSWNDLKPKLYNLFEKDSRLKYFPHFKWAMREVGSKFIRVFYRVLFDKLAPKNVAAMEAEILEFRGFSFDKFSDESLTRKHLLNKLSDLSVRKICYLLDLPNETGMGKGLMIFSIMKFLHNPTKNVHCRIDPFQSCMQPFVKLEKLPFEYKYLEEVKPADQQVGKVGPSQRKVSGNMDFSNTIQCSQVIKRRGRPSKTAISMGKAIISKSKSPQSSSGLPLKKSPLPVTSTSHTKVANVAKEIGVSSRKKSVIEAKKAANLQKTKGRILNKALKGGVKKNSAMIKSKKNNMNRKIKKLKIEITELKVKVDETYMHAKSNAENGAILPSFGKKKDNEDIHSESSSSIHQELINEDDLSEVTLSADENIETSKKGTQTRTKKKKMMRSGKPLRTFTNIRDSIKNGNFSALQRLHILLFGASDRPENLKANILAFGGFPFLEGSDEWKQKEFLLSLLSLSTLKEYLTLLCIDHEGDDQQAATDKLMKFLAAPGGFNAEVEAEIIFDEPVQEMKTKVIHSEAVKPVKPFVPSSPQPIKIVDAKSIAPITPIRKVVKKKEKKKEPRHRKVLMSEAEVRRLEADIKREQRIKEREKRLNDQLALKNALAAGLAPTPTLQKNIISQASSLNLHKTPLGTSVYLPIPEVKTAAGGSAANRPQAITPKGQKATTARGKQQTKTSSEVPLPTMVKQADAEQLNALLQTVYRRRQLKAAGAKISTLRTGDTSKLGELPNVKFLVVTANYSDLDVLHHLIYMTDAVKAKVRKNILDFAGFGFNEDSPLYKDRIDFLNTLGYDISKRIAFLLGLCPYKTTIDKQDLNELIMYFLMSPSKSKQVPITHLPQTFFSKNMPEELCVLMQKHGDLEISPVLDTSNDENAMEGSVTLKPMSKLDSPRASASNTKPQSTGKKVKKDSVLKSVTPLSLPPVTPSFRHAAPLEKTISPIPKTSMDTSTYALQKAILKTSSLPVTSPQEFLVQQMTPDGKQKTYKLIKLPANHPLTSAIKPKLPISQPPTAQITVPSSVGPTLSSTIPTPAIPPVPKPATITQTPSVQLPVSTALVQMPLVSTALVQTPPVSLGATVTSSVTNPPGVILPPGLIIFKNKNNAPVGFSTSSLQNSNLSTVPLVIGQQNPVILPQNILSPSQLHNYTKKQKNLPASESSNESDSISVRPVSDVTPTSSKQVSKPGPASRQIKNIKELLEAQPPTDGELFLSIQNIINNSDPEQITLRNVIDQVTKKYSRHDLGQKHAFMKECVKKIILENM